MASAVPPTPPATSPPSPKNVSSSSSTATTTGPAPLLASALTIQPTTTPREVPSAGSPLLLSQSHCSDHMLTAHWALSTGWTAPTIVPYGPFSLMPTASVLHYATECFEGMKAYRGVDGRVRLFRPDLNAKRLRRSAQRIALPDFDDAEFLALLRKFVGYEAPKWLPREWDDETKAYKEKMVYLRPALIATQPGVGVQRPIEAMLFVVMVCFPDLDKPSTAPPPLSLPPTTSAATTEQGKETSKTPVVRTGNAQITGRGMKLVASSSDQIRAFPGGWGHAKLGANYGPTLLAQGEARARGFQQVLWLFGEQNFVTEAGASNFFVLWDTPEGKRELVTAPLDQGIILPGVTRASVIQLVRERVNGVEVVEKNFTMDELVQAQEQGRLIEAFACGTAYFVSPVQEIDFRGKDVALPLKATTDEEGDKGRELAIQLKGWLKDIMYGRESHEWGNVIEEE
ncbi:hypothetical protein DV735_g3409, partial [Chaetothyriales sp. CBS 134920]